MKNKKGSTIVWAVMLIMVLMVIVGASLSFAYINYNKSITYKSSTQAELTAESVAQALASQITEASTSPTFETTEDQANADHTKALIPEENADPIVVDGSDIEISNQKMGKVESITFTRNQNNKLTITVKATYSGQSASVDAIMKKDKDSNIWTIYNYERAKS